MGFQRSHATPRYPRAACPRRYPSGALVPSRADGIHRYTTPSGLVFWLHLFPGWRCAYPGLQYRTPLGFARFGEQRSVELLVADPSRVGPKFRKAPANGEQLKARYELW